MNTFELEAERRDDRGKGASRRLRRAGKIPAIVYGADAEPLAIRLDHTATLLQTQNEGFYSHILTLKVDGRAERVVLKDMQRHVYKPFITHMDFLRVSESEQLTIRVPLHFVNEDRCVGVKTGGGSVSHLMNDLEITCLPKDLPEYIDVDIADLDVGEAIHLHELVMPAGVQVTSLLHGGDPNIAVVSVHQARAIETVEEEGGAAESGEAGTEGA